MIFMVLNLVSIEYVNVPYFIRSKDMVSLMRI